MMQFLTTGKAIYVIAAICAVGLFSKLLVRNLYRRLIKQSDNMMSTNNRVLRQIKQKAENAYRVNSGINNVSALVERQLYQCKRLGLPIRTWDNLAACAALLCFLLGGTGAFLAFRGEAPMGTIVLYGACGVLFGVLNLFFDNLMDTAGKRQQLLVHMSDYVENTLLGRLARGLAIEEPEEEEQEEEEKDSGRDIEYLKRSLDQIAASKERSRRGQDRQGKNKRFGPEEEKLIEEIIKEYLS